jgi:predicted chitinase
MSELKITGNTAPVVGKEESYSVNQLLPSSIPTEILNGSKPNPFEFPVEWSVHVLENGKWIKKEENNKTGNKVSYKFTQKSLERKGIRILAKKGEQTARLDVKPHNAESPKIDSIEFLDKNGNKPTKPFAYGQILKARVHCLHMERRTVYATLWEDDAAGAGHNKANEKNKMKTLPGTVKGGIADIDFVLEPDFAKIANAVKAKGNADEGKTHEYYVTAEILNKKTASTNTNVANPSYKDTTAKPGTPKKETPAQKKGPSKKQEKEKSIGDEITDWWEGLFKVKPIVAPNPKPPTGNNPLKVGEPDKNPKDEKKEEKKKGKCFCNRDITPDELTKMVKNIRDNTYYDGKTITFYHDDKLFYLYANVPKSERTFKKFAEVINKAFDKYEITTCARKIHFLSNMYVETMYFTATREGKGTSGFRYDPYRGRGFQHLTWEDNYKKYKKETGIDIINDYEKVADDLNIAADTGAWYWKKMGLNDYADKDSIFDTSRLINYPGATKSSSINGYKNRETAWKELKKIFKFPEDCINNKKENKPSKPNCNKCNVEHYDLTNKVKWQTQFDPKWGEKKKQNVACKKTCDDILNKNGLTSTSISNKYQTALENNNHTSLIINTEESKRGIKYLDIQLKEGNPVQVGVDHALNYKGGTLNEGTTDHFIVIVGKSCDNGKVFYRFYDVGTSHESKGASESNRLYLDSSNYSLKGKTAYNGNFYTVTQIRNNKKK